MKLSGKKICFLGDSITEGCGTSEPGAIFTNLIAEKYHAVCRNYGIGGTRIARQHHPSEELIYDQDFCKRAETMDADADIIVVFGGTNDFGHGDAPLGTMADRTAETFYGALHVLCNTLISRYSKAKVVIITPLHRTDEDNLRGDGSKNEDMGTLKTYVDIIREVAEYYTLPVLDLFSDCSLQPKVPLIQKKYMPDGLHPNGAGHQLLADRIGRFQELL